MEAEDKDSGGDGDEDKKPKMSVRTVVLDDGTYSQQTTVINPAEPAVEAKPIPSLRSCLLKGDYFLASVVASTITKLCLRLEQLSGPNDQDTHIRKAEAMLIMT